MEGSSETLTQSPVECPAEDSVFPLGLQLSQRVCLYIRDPEVRFVCLFLHLLCFVLQIPNSSQTHNKSEVLSD